MGRPEEGRGPRDGAGPMGLMSFDRDSALARVVGDNELLDEVIGLFLDEAPLMLSEIGGAIDRRDSRSLERAAHKLKGSAANLGADAVAHVAGGLDAMGRSGDLQGAQEAYEVLESEMGRLERAMAPPERQHAR